MRKKYFNSLKGFTLIELLVTTAVMGLLAVVSANIISSVLKSQNKTSTINEVRQNGDLVIAKLERDIKGAVGVSPLGSSTSITLDMDGELVVWECTEEVLGDSGVFTRASQTVTNDDDTRGVSVLTCEFLVSGAAGTGGPQIVQLHFDLAEAEGAPGRSEFEVVEPFQVTVGTRVYTTN